MAAAVRRAVLASRSRHHGVGRGQYLGLAARHFTHGSARHVRRARRRRCVLCRVAAWVDGGDDRSEFGFRVLALAVGGARYWRPINGAAAFGQRRRRLPCARGLRRSIVPRAARAASLDVLRLPALLCVDQRSDAVSLCLRPSRAVCPRKSPGAARHRGRSGSGDRPRRTAVVQASAGCPVTRPHAPSAQCRAAVVVAVDLRHRPSASCIARHAGDACPARDSSGQRAGSVRRAAVWQVRARDRSHPRAGITARRASRIQSVSPKAELRVQFKRRGSRRRREDRRRVARLADQPAASPNRARAARYSAASRATSSAVVGTS